MIFIFNYAITNMERKIRKLNLHKMVCNGSINGVNCVVYLCFYLNINGKKIMKVWEGF